MGAAKGGWSSPAATEGAGRWGAGTPAWAVAAGSALGAFDFDGGCGLHDSSPWECGVWLGLGVEAYSTFGAGVVVGPLGLATEGEGSVLTESTDVCNVGRVGTEGEALGLDLGSGFCDGFEFCGSGRLPSIHGRLRGVAVGDGVPPHPYLFTPGVAVNLWTALFF